MVKKLELQTLNSAGRWNEVSLGEFESIAKTIIERDKWYAKRVNRNPLKTIEEVLELLKTEKEFQYGGDWHERVRAKPQPITREQQELNELSRQYWGLDAKIMESGEPSLQFKLKTKQSEIFKKLNTKKGK